MEEHLCEGCGLPLVRKNGKGPWPKRCAECKRAQHAKGRQAHVESAESPAPTAAPESAPEAPKARQWFEVRLTPENASADGPDEAQHDACRQAAYDAAETAGLLPRGGWQVFRLVRVEASGDEVAYVYGAGVCA